MANPFTMRVIAPDLPFCNRTEELRDLRRHAVRQMDASSHPGRTLQQDHFPAADRRRHHAAGKRVES